MPSKPIRYYTQAAVLIALSIVIRRFIVPQSLWGLNLGGLPLILAGYVLGPWGGALVGAVSDLMGVWMGGGLFTPLVTISSAVTGALPAAVLMMFPVERRMAPWPVCLSVAVGQLTTKVLLLPWFLSLSGILKGSIPAAMAHQVVVQAWHIPLYTLVLLPLLQAYRHGTGRSPAILVRPGDWVPGGRLEDLPNSPPIQNREQ